MSSIKLILFLLACLAVQMKLPFYFLGIPLAAELLFVSAAAYAVVHGSVRGLAAGAAAGILQGAFSQAPFGLTFFSFTLIAGFAGLFRRFIFVERALTRLALIGAATLLLYTTRLAYFAWMEQDFPFWIALYEGLVPMLLWNSAAAAPVFLAMKWAGLAQPADEDRERRSAEYFRRFRGRLAGKSQASGRRDLSWK